MADWIGSEARVWSPELIRRVRDWVRVGVSGDRDLGMMWRWPWRRKRRLAAVSGLSQRGRWKADSMRRNSPSESKTRMERSGKDREVWRRRKTTNHSSSRLSP